MLIFHLCLLGLIVLAGVGQLTHLKARVALAEGEAFNPDALVNVRKGIFHAGKIGQVSFVQGAFSIAYAAGMHRGRTDNDVYLPQASGKLLKFPLGDDRPMVQQGYRFYTTPGKGFAPRLTWLPDVGAPYAGSMHMPAYPANLAHQTQYWTLPSGEKVKFTLQVKTALRFDADWVLQKEGTDSVLMLSWGKAHAALRPGEAARLPGGRLRYERLDMWMGYEVFYDPTLRGLFFCAILGILALARHLGWKMRNAAWLLPEESASTVRGGDVARSLK